MTSERAKIFWALHGNTDYESAMAHICLFYSQSKSLPDRHSRHISLIPHAARTNVLDELRRVFIACALHYDTRVSHCRAHIACGKDYFLDNYNKKVSHNFIHDMKRLVMHRIDLRDHFDVIGILDAQALAEEAPSERIPHSLAGLVLQYQLYPAVKPSNQIPSIQMEKNVLGVCIMEEMTPLQITN